MTMYKLQKIDLGKDEAEQDSRLKEYFLKTQSYNNAIEGSKTLIVGRKGSGKSAIFKYINETLEEDNIVIPVTPNQYAWGTLKEYTENGILPEQAHTNAWKLTLLAAIVWKLNESGALSTRSQLTKYYKYMQESYAPSEDNWLFNIIEKAHKLLKGVKTKWLSFEFEHDRTAPLRIINALAKDLQAELPKDKNIRITIDRLDDSWDSSEESKVLIVGLLKAANDLNNLFEKRVIITIFLRSDIYSNLYFHDQDKVRQYEEQIFWNKDELKAVVAERVRASLKLKKDTSVEEIWENLFSPKPYRQSAKADKYIIDRTFKRPRDVISFVRFAIENAIKNGNKVIETIDTRTAEEEKYSESKFRDLVIENQKQNPFTKDLLDSFSSSKHKISKRLLSSHLKKFLTKFEVSTDISGLIRFLFSIGFLGIKRKGRAGAKQRGGEAFYFNYDDPKINPLSHKDFYIHPSLRYYLNITEKRERKSGPKAKTKPKKKRTTKTTKKKKMVKKKKKTLPAKKKLKKSKSKK